VEALVVVDLEKGTGIIEPLGSSGRRVPVAVGVGWDDGFTQNVFIYQNRTGAYVGLMPSREARNGSGGEMTCEPKTRDDAR
jgi:hypothetical protein